jgi:TrmH family RNA methyltransferase
MISKATIKFIKSLQIKKYRKQEQRFVVEGAKSVQELIASDFEVAMIVGSADFLSRLKVKEGITLVEATEKEIGALGEFQTNSAAVAIARMKPNEMQTIQKNEFGLVLDDIRDPGNLGTILRIADWYGISKIIASEETADLYNSKVITASMGSFTRIRVYYTDIEKYILTYGSGTDVWGAFLNGSDVHNVDFGNSGLIVIGNESRGISAGMERLITSRITIPRYGKAESLNAAVAAAVICDNLRRRKD